MTKYGEIGMINLIKHEELKHDARIFKLIKFEAVCESQMPPGTRNISLEPRPPK